jgi:hypothetical protein
MKPTVGRVVHFHDSPTGPPLMAFIIEVELIDQQRADVAAGDETAYSVTLEVHRREGTGATPRVQVDCVLDVPFSHTTSSGGYRWSWPAVPIAGKP